MQRLIGSNSAKALLLASSFYAAALLPVAAAHAQQSSPQPQRGLFYHSDHFPLAKQGVPVLLLMALGGGVDLVGGGRAAGDKWVADYTANCYHQPCDIWRPELDFRGAAQDAALAYDVARDLAFSTDWPSWKPGSEFKGARDRSAAARSK